MDLNTVMASGPCPAYQTTLGALFAGDCLDVLPQVRDGVVDTFFADPPFNLKKEYGAQCQDDLSPAKYVEWCQHWIREGVRVLRPGGAFFLYNIPKWNVELGAYLTRLGMTFRHWIAIDLTLGFPRGKSLFPSHYSLLFYTKGEPFTFRRIRTPIQRCRKCATPIKDYGGHAASMNHHGVTLKDVWGDIAPVRHSKFQAAGRRANALSTKLLERVVEMTTRPGDLVLDPFGGSGTTFAVCEARGRRWLGVELDFAAVIIDRLKNPLPHHHNDDFVDD